MDARIPSNANEDQWLLILRGTQQPSSVLAWPLIAKW